LSSSLLSSGGGFAYFDTRKVGGVLTVQGRRIAGATKKAAAKSFALNVEVSINAIDTKILDAVAFNNAAYVRDQFGVRSEAMSLKAKEVVANGLEKGLGREGLRAELQSTLGAAAAAQSANYWRTVANAFAGMARSYGNLSVYADAGVTKYRVEAILDSSTTLECRFLHGRVYEVPKAIANLEAASPVRPPPWLYHGKDANGDMGIYYKEDGERQWVGRVEEDARGKPDEVGRFSGAASSADLADAGIDTPPFHGNCRTTILAEL